jgi:hypothetical protein
MASGKNKSNRQAWSQDKGQKRSSKLQQREDMACSNGEGSASSKGEDLTQPQGRAQWEEEE